MLRLHPDIALPAAHRICAAKSLEFPQHVDDAVNQPTRYSSSGASAYGAQDWHTSASVVIFGVRTRRTSRHQVTSPPRARACSGWSLIAISRHLSRSWAISYEVMDCPPLVHPCGFSLRSNRWLASTLCGSQSSDSLAVGPRSLAGRRRGPNLCGSCIAISAHQESVTCSAMALGGELPLCSAG